MVSHDLQWQIQGTHRLLSEQNICCSGLPESIQQHPEYQAIFGTQRMFYQHHHNHCGHSDHVEPQPRSTPSYSPRTKGLSHDGMVTTTITSAWIMGTLLVFLTAPLAVSCYGAECRVFADTMAHGTLFGVAVAGILHLPFGWVWAVWRHCWLPFYGF